MFFSSFYVIKSVIVVQEVKKRLSAEAAAAANRDGRWRNQMRRAAHNGCCRRVAQIRALSSVLWKLVISEELVGALTKIENPLVSCFSGYSEVSNEFGNGRFRCCGNVVRTYGERHD